MNMLRIGCTIVAIMSFCKGGQCESTAISMQDSTTQIRVINNSRHSFTGVSLFSMRFEDLKPNDTTEFKQLKYDPMRDDPLIYCIENGKNLGRYVTIPDATVRYYNYRIDSIGNGILYISSFEDKLKD